MLTFVGSIALFQLASFSNAFAWSPSAGAAQTFAVSEDKIQEWESWNGHKVDQVLVYGLVRTKLNAVRWLMKTKSGEPFSAEVFAQDLQRLFNTGNLYDIQGFVVRSENGDSENVEIHVSVKDKWTLFPVFGGQGGGGSLTVGGGIYESNLLGYFANSSFLMWQFNGTNSYDLNVNQEYFAGTQTMWSLDIQDSINAQIAHGVNGLSLGQYAWRRQQKEIMVGTHLPGPVRLMFYGSVFQDSVFNNDGGLNIQTPDGLQQRFYPKLIYGKVDWSNYLESGFEFTVQPTFANLLGPGPKYTAIEFDAKKVMIIGPHHNDNLALFFSTSHMGSGGPSYLYEVGGYANVRGYPDLREVGRRIAYTNIEYRPFLFSHRWDFLGLDLMAVQGCLFSDFGAAWDDPTLTREEAARDFRPLWSVGSGLRINMVKFAGAILRFDLARTIKPDEGMDFSFGIGQFF